MSRTRAGAACMKSSRAVRISCTVCELDTMTKPKPIMPYVSRTPQLTE